MPKPQRKNFFTKDNAKEMARRSHAVQAANRLAGKCTVPLKQLLAPGAPDDLYQQGRVRKIREQIEAVNKLLDGETDAVKLDRYASALCRLAELERVTAGRPLPGARRPSPERAGRAVPFTAYDFPSSPAGAQEAASCGVDAPAGGVPSQNPAGETTQGSSAQCLRG